MNSGVAMMEARVLPSASAPEVDLTERVLAGLRQRPKRVPSSYFYDDEGSRLFRRIMQLPGYYLSRAELEILQAAAPRLAGTFAGQNLVVADLGAGDGSKTRVLLRALAGACRDICYAPIDISPGALGALERAHGPELSRVTLEPLVASFEAGLYEVGCRYPGHTRLALLLGSNIGNFPQPE